MGLLGMADATIEDLAFAIRSSRNPDPVRRRGCIEHDKKPFNITEIDAFG
jgi:hypothetical protein